MREVSTRLKNLVMLVPMRGAQGKKKGYCNEQFKRPYAAAITVLNIFEHVLPTSVNLFIKRYISMIVLI